MNLDKIQLTFKENDKLGTIIRTIPIYGLENTLNNKVKLYLTQKAEDIIRYHNPMMELNNNNKLFFVLPYLPNYYFMVAYTILNVNHPYLIYFNLNHTYINVLLPLGKDYGQVNINDYNELIKMLVYSNSTTKTTKNSKSNIVLLTAIYLLLNNTIEIRKNGILNSQFNILSCENIPVCITKMNDISKMKLSESEKQGMYKKYNEHYLTLGFDLLKNYFRLLSTKKYSEAYSFLKGGNTIHNEYYKKRRLNNFFKNNKSIIGHLEIFISLYEILHMVRLKLLNY
jgi:hypothetical protein